MPVEQNSALVPTRDSSNLKHQGSCTMELHFVNLLSLALIWCINHDKGKCVATAVDCSVLASKQIDQEVQI